MRLIDADLFLENARKELNCEGKCCECEHDNLCEIYKMVNEQPTAYDVDKAVEQLEKAKYEDELYPCNLAVEIEEAKSIVKSGGIE